MSIQKIRFIRNGKKSQKSFEIRIQDVRKATSSGTGEKIGFYLNKNEFKIDCGKYIYYLLRGAQPTPRVISLINSQYPLINQFLKKNKQEIHNASRFMSLTYQDVQAKYN